MIRGQSGGGATADHVEDAVVVLLQGSFQSLSPLGVRPVLEAGQPPGRMEHGVERGEMGMCS
jgi:hypothetical protein